MTSWGDLDARRPQAPPRRWRNSGTFNIRQYGQRRHKSTDLGYSCLGLSGGRHNVELSKPPRRRTAGLARHDCPACSIRVAMASARSSHSARESQQRLYYLWTPAAVVRRRASGRHPSQWPGIGRDVLRSRRRSTAAGSTAARWPAGPIPRQLQCPFNEGNQTNDCAALEQDPNCGFLRSDCVEGRRTTRGICYYEGNLGLRHLAFNSGAEAGAVDRVRWPGTLHGHRLRGPQQRAVRRFRQGRRGAGSRPDDGHRHAVRPAVAVAWCSTARSNECKRAVGGIVNCCKTPEGVSLGNYLTLVFSLAKLDSAIMGMNKGGAIRGSWEALRQPLTSTWSAVKESFSSVANSLTGATSRSGDRCGRARCSRQRPSRRCSARR